jgi:hypothetical protein
MTIVVPVQTEVEGSAPGASTLPRAVDEAALLAVTDPWERARQATELAGHLQRLSNAVLRIRREAVCELVAGGTPPAHVARYIGRTRARVSQLLESSRRDGAAAEAVMA